MAAESCSAMTVHRVRFPVIIARDERALSGPATAARWLFGPYTPLGSDDRIVCANEIWGGFACYADRETAEAVMADLKKFVPWLPEASEEWHGLVIPVAHHGEVNWFGPPGTPAPFRCGADPGGKLMVITSAGYNAMPEDELAADMPRRLVFIRQVRNVQQWLAQAPGNRAATVYSVGRPADAATVSIWDSDAAMHAAIYRPGLHREQMDRHRTGNLADRTSFTRARILCMRGTWDGIRLH